MQHQEQGTPRMDLRTRTIKQSGDGLRLQADDGEKCTVCYWSGFAEVHDCARAVIACQMTAGKAQPRHATTCQPMRRASNAQHMGPKKLH
eukprot:53806-Pelagomonas_calceolata.AAC.6